MPEESIDFFAKYKDWLSVKTFEVSDKTNAKDVGSFLLSVKDEVSERAFTVLGIDTKSLKSYSTKAASGVSKKDYTQIPIVYKSTTSADAQAQIEKACANREEIKPFGQAYLFRSILEELGIGFNVSKKLDKVQKGNAPNVDMIYLMAKYGDWVSIKKMSIDAKTKPEEVSAHLTSIRSTSYKKGVEFLGVDIILLDEYAANSTTKMRKSAANLEKVISIINSPDAKQKISAACNGKRELEEDAKSYLFGTMLKNLKFDYDVNPETLQTMFPGLKIPKPKGRMPGQKKRLWDKSHP